MCAEPYRTLLKTDRNCLDSWCAGPTDRRFHRRNLPSQGAVQRTCIGHVSLIRTCTGKNHVQSKGKLCDHVEAVGNIGSPNLYPIAPIPNLSSLSITFLKVLYLGSLLPYFTIFKIKCVFTCLIEQIKKLQQDLTVIWILKEKMNASGSCLTCIYQPPFCNSIYYIRHLSNIT